MDLLLHGSWHEGAFFLWAESSEAAPHTRGRKPAVPWHPHAATEAALRRALQTCAHGAEPVAGRRTRTLLLPTTPHGPCLPPWMTPDGNGAERDAEEGTYLAPWKVTGLELDVLRAVDLLVALPVDGMGTSAWRDGDATEPGQMLASLRAGPDLRFWSMAAKFGLELLAQHKYLPGMERDARRYRAVWLPVVDGPGDRARLQALAEAMPPVCRALFPADAAPDPAHAPLPYALLDSFVSEFIDRAVRDWGRDSLDRRYKAPVGLAGAWWRALWADDGRLDIAVSQRRELERLNEQWKAWLAQLAGEAEAAFRLCFRLAPPEIDQETGKVTSPDWHVHYLLQASDDPSLLVTAEQVWNARGGTLRILNHKFEGAQERMLAGLGLASRLFPPITSSLRTARPQACALTVDEAYAFLREAGPLLKSSGFGVLVPPWWEKRGARLGVRATVQAEADAGGRGILSMDSVVEFNWELALGDQALTRQEFERLAALKMPLVQVRGQWVMLQPEEIEAAIAFWEKKRHQQEMPLRDALGLVLGAEAEVDGLPLTGVETQGWMDELLHTLHAGDTLAQLRAPDGFRGEMRPYQLRGYSWLAFLRKWGLGACLADDMGLGKTIQAIALLLQAREMAGDDEEQDSEIQPALVICPTSVVGNWRREIERFAPGLRVMVHHGGDRASGEEFVAAATGHDIVISTYGLARRDVDDLSGVLWSDVILDEAQNIKNPHAKQTQAVRRLVAANRIALTGTPVENRLSELWSIMHFLNPGFLGSLARFRSQVALPIERYGDQAATQRLKGLTGPFILRRVKTDPAIIQDLPDKFEAKVYCNLTSEQATLYEAVVKDSMVRVESAEGMAKRGEVLGLLTRLKQVCNHPAQFLGDGSALAGRSGKLERLGEMLEEALSVGDKALVFTQFAEMGHMLRAHLQALFGIEVLYLHGGTPQKQRDRIVARFQGSDGPPVLLLSLKAGGTGLNLTAANHVFHFDRWWNPAVENQATDRAFRIGQARDVQVHKFLCAGTLEERIDALIESKQALAESVVGAGEGWLTELGTDELRELLVLRRE